MITHCSNEKVGTALATSQIDEKGIAMHEHNENTEKTTVMGDAEGGGKGKAAQVREKPGAVKDIMRTVVKARKAAPQDVEQTLPPAEKVEEAVIAAADQLYDAYESSGTVPTREAFAQQCTIPYVGNTVLAMQRDPFLKRPLAPKIAAGVVAVAVVAGLGIGAWAIAGGGQQAAEQAPATEQEAVEEDDEEVTGTVRLDIDAPGWGEGSSPFIVHVIGATDEGDGVNFYHAVRPDGSTSEIKLASGTYRLEWTSAINSDGSIYRVPEEPTEVVVDDSTDSSGDSAAPVIDAGGSFEQVPAEDVTQDDLDDILDDIEQAVGAGDETLSGEAGQEVVDTATENASNNPNADKDKVEQAGEEASGNVSDDTKGPNGTGASGSSSDNGGTSSGGGTQPSGSGGSSTSGGGSTGGSSQPSHTHNWVAQTTQQWVQDSAAWSEQVWVQDSAAWSEQVQTGSHIQCSCGATFSTNSDWSAHNRDQMISTGSGHSYSVVPTYETIHHEATGHYETVHHEATGHYETVTTGYVCSGCGAMK